jgi:hypothetical protein
MAPFECALSARLASPNPSYYGFKVARDICVRLHRRVEASTSATIVSTETTSN